MKWWHGCVFVLGIVLVIVDLVVVLDFGNDSGINVQNPTWLPRIPALLEPRFTYTEIRVS